MDALEPDHINEAGVIDHRKRSRLATTQGVPHTEETKAVALAVYAETGSVDTAAKETGLPPTTIRNWVERDPEIDAKLDALRFAVRTRVAHTYAEIARRAAEELLDRVNNGDYHIDREGNITRKPIPGRELAFISSVAADKHALLTGIVVKTKGEDASLQKLAEGLLAAIDKRQLRAKADAAVPQGSEPNSGD
jgi:hypothetical protein